MPAVNWYTNGGTDLIYVFLNKIVENEYELKDVYRRDIKIVWKQFTLDMYSWTSTSTSEFQGIMRGFIIKYRDIVILETDYYEVDIQTLLSEDGDGIVSLLFSDIDLDLYETGASPVRMIGNNRDNIIEGHDGKDVLLGLYGNDKLRGERGDDRASGGAGDDSLRGGGGNDYLKGNAGSDIIMGGRGDDRIVGGTDSDELYGDDGSDSFVFGKGALASADTVYGFERIDQISVDSSVFSYFTEKGTIDKENFIRGTHAIESDDVFILDPSTGVLFYDADGSGSADPIQIVQFLFSTPLTYRDIIIV